MKTRLVLASGSPRRRELMAQIGLTPEILVSEVDESTSLTTPSAVVKELSMRKARAVAESLDDENALVIGADTVVSVDGTILGKPATHEEAAEMIRLLQGREHQVYTGVSLVKGTKRGEKSSFSDSFATETSVRVYPMTEEEILAYARSEEPMDKAGAYGIQGSFAAFISGIDGDYNNVVGLPIGRLYQSLKRYL